MLLNYAAIKKMENWKKIADYDNYSVSDTGRVRNDATGRILKNRVTKNGYHNVNLSINGVATINYVHRLVANAFIQNPDNKPQVDHINNNPANNCIHNLRWVTQSENNYNKTCVKNAKHIRLKGNGYEVYLSINGKCYFKYAPTMDDAIRIRDELLLQRKSEMGF